MSWEVIPEGETATVLNATAEGRCVACYGPIRPEHGGFYCCGCDDGHPDECDGGPDV